MTMSDPTPTGTTPVNTTPASTSPVSTTPVSSSPTGTRGVEIRRATASDLEALQANDPRPQLGLPARRLAEQDAGTGILAVASIDGNVVGMGFLDFVDEELQPELKNLWINPEARRRHAGTRLWRWLEQQAADAGHRQVFLAVDPNNSRAIPMFLELGYSPTGDHVSISDPDASQVLDPAQVSTYYAIYRKSLLAG